MESEKEGNSLENLVDKEITTTPEKLLIKGKGGRLRKKKSLNFFDFGSKRKGKNNSKRKKVKRILCRDQERKQ